MKYISINQSSKNILFKLDTANTSYMLAVTEFKDLQHIYYGDIISKLPDYQAVVEHRSLLLVSALYDERKIGYGIDNMQFEYQSMYRGDMRDGAIKLEDKHGKVFSFKYVSHSIDENVPTGNIAHSKDCDASLKVTMKDEKSELYLELWYLVYYDANVIVRFSKLINKTNAIVYIEKIASCQLDLDHTDVKVVSFDGAWCRERYKNEQILNSGKLVLESLSGASSNRHNPFIMVTQRNADNYNGDCYGFNLVYSGSHAESIEVTPYGNTRILCGINESDFRYTLKANEAFYSPECMMTFASNGYNGVSRNAHNFVNNHIIPSAWRHTKPVLLNSWEAMYFNISEEKILALAEKAVQVGAEIMVVDDGWFKGRNDDTSSLGDWVYDKIKFPNGLNNLVDKVHAKGIKFGLWFEPEMISENSDLYRSHPEYAWRVSSVSHIVGRGQMLLDMTNPDVQDYLVDMLSSTINDNHIDYVKWDFNRLASDVVSRKFASGELLHRYILGLYSVQDRLTKLCPNVLFEFCASGGNRFDLGMLCFSPIGWVSDNTDVYSRTFIQEGTSYGYPLSCMCNHISAVPNHQTKRTAKLADRYNTASFGTLGMQLNLLELSEEELTDIKEYIGDYKYNIELFQHGKFSRLIDTFSSANSAWQLMNSDKSYGKILVGSKLFQPVMPTLRLKLNDIFASSDYEITNHDINFSITASGELLIKHGFVLPQNYQGNETSMTSSMLMDYSTIIFDIEKV